MITASGGIVYHARAARSLIKLFNPLGSWNPTRRRVSSWVRNWVESHSFKTLILVGPSAAYLIDDNIWSEIEQLVVIEPDRLAKWIFKLRFATSGRAKAPQMTANENSHMPAQTWLHRNDLLPYFSRKPDEFSEFLKNYDPQTTGVLFFGCLGQMPFHEKEFLRPEAEARALLLDATSSFSTASLHDLASVTVPALAASTAREFAELDLELDLDGPKYDSNVIAKFIDQFSGRIQNAGERINELETLRSSANTSGSPSAFQAKRKSVLWPEKKSVPRPEHISVLRSAPLVWTDHDTYWFGRPRAACAWALTPTQIHILGFVETSSR